MWKLIKQRQEGGRALRQAADGACRSGGAAKIEIITAFFPKQMSEAEAAGRPCASHQSDRRDHIKDMGKVIGRLKQGLCGRLDFGKAKKDLCEAMLSG